MDLSLLVTVLALSGAPTQGPCLSNADTTNILVRQIRQTLDLTDSIQLAAHGLPVQITEIRPIHDDQLCTAALAAYNGPGTGHGRPATRQVYVFALDTAA